MSTLTLVPLDDFRPTPKPLNGTEAQYARKKCLRCGQFYADATNGECHYHPGVYEAPGPSIRKVGFLFCPIFQGAEVGWSCCRIIEIMEFHLSRVNDAALDRNLKGCKTAGMLEAN
jgi:hypothetical protein